MQRNSLANTMDLLHYASQLNREGASSLADNNSITAFEYFRHALEVVVLGVPHSNPILNGCPSLAKAASSLFLNPRLFHSLLWSDGSTAANDVQQQQLDPHIFSKAFLFQPREDERELALQVRTYIAIIFFNLAATLHQRSASMQRHCDQSLHIALELYDVGFDLLIQEDCVDDLSNDVSLAILNNMAEVHWALSDFSKASRVVELQKGLLEIIFSNKRPHNFSEQEMEIFILNTHLLQAPAGAAAA